MEEKLGHDDLEGIPFKQRFREEQGPVATKPLHSVPDCHEDDGTPAAHPAWWRGHNAAVADMCQKIKAVIDGSDDGSFPFAEPWESVRRELIELKKWDGRAK